MDGHGSVSLSVSIGGRFDQSGDNRTEFTMESSW